MLAGIQDLHGIARFARDYINDTVAARGCNKPRCTRSEARTYVKYVRENPASPRLRGNDSIKNLLDS